MVFINKNSLLKSVKHFKMFYNRVLRPVLCFMGLYVVGLIASLPNQSTAFLQGIVISKELITGSLETEKGPERG